LDFEGGLSEADRKKLRDNNVLDIINNHVNADAITFISLSWCPGITNATLMCIADKCTQLETLFVSGCDMISDAGITSMAKKNNKLRILSYPLCTRVTDAALEVITNECQQLELLNASGCGHSKLPFNFGTKLPNLTVLNLENNKLSTLPESLGQLADKCKHFRISGNPLQQPPPEIAKRGLGAIARYYQELQNGSSDDEQYQEQKRNSKIERKRPRKSDKNSEGKKLQKRRGSWKRKPQRGRGFSRGRRRGREKLV
jgi:Leucine-rich repeat (LRR) protein